MLQKKQAKQSSLVVVGSGIKFMSHLQLEPKINIEKAEKVLYLVNEPAIQEWIQRIHPNSESLDSFYAHYPLRLHNYQKITSYILENLKKKQHVCVVMYGHPTVFAQPALDAVIQAKKGGYHAEVLPGISAVDCLFADLLIDFGIRGCQLLEATDLLVNCRKHDPSCPLILWQVGIIGMLGHLTSHHHDNTNAAKILRRYLEGYYSLSHDVILYEAAQYPGFKPKIDKFPLKKLPEAQFSRISTLYIPPEMKNTIDESMLKLL